MSYCTVTSLAPTHRVLAWVDAVGRSRPSLDALTDRDPLFRYWYCRHKRTRQSTAKLPVLTLAVSEIITQILMGPNEDLARVYRKRSQRTRIIRRRVRHTLHIWYHDWLSPTL